MIAVIFEVQLADGQSDEYLSIAERIRPLLEEIDGFHSVERFQSLSNPQKLLSLSYFRDEQAVLQWRKVVAHRDAQQRGRGGIFKDYRLRVAAVLRDYSMHDREQAPSPVTSTM